MSVYPIIISRTTTETSCQPYKRGEKGLLRGVSATMPWHRLCLLLGCERGLGVVGWERGVSGHTWDSKVSFWPGGGWVESDLAFVTILL